MNKALIHKISKNEQEANANILKAFGFAYASKDVQNIKTYCIRMVGILGK